jgi:hypothetical protein
MLAADGFVKTTIDLIGETVAKERGFKPKPK